MTMPNYVNPTIKSVDFIFLNSDSNIFYRMEWLDVLLCSIYEKLNVMFFQIISFEEYFLFFLIYLTFVMIFNCVISEITWFTHLYNKRNSFQFFKNFRKQFFSFLLKYSRNKNENTYYSCLCLFFFY